MPISRCRRGSAWSPRPVRRRRLCNASMPRSPPSPNSRRRGKSWPPRAWSRGRRRRNSSPSASRPITPSTDRSSRKPGSPSIEPEHAIMSIEFIGFLAHQEASESVVPHGPLVNPEFVGAYARTQEYGGFDKALIAYHSAAPDGFQVAAYAARETSRLGLLIAHRPGVVAPTVAARQFATLDHFSQGRAA